MPEQILSLSYGKDSLACLGAIEELGWPLDRIVHAEVWATDTIPADLPPMVEFKAKADEIISLGCCAGCFGLYGTHILVKGGIDVERKENLFQPPEYTAEMFAEYFESEKARALRASEIEAILGDDYDLDRLRNLVEADRDRAERRTINEN